MSWKDDARERVKEKKQGATYKLTEGLNCFRILPNKKGLDKPPYLEIFIHRDVGPDKGWCRCGKNIDGTGKCWICDSRIPSLMKSGSPQKRQRAEALARREQFIVQVSAYDPETKKFSSPKPFWPSTGGRQSLSVKILAKLASDRRSYDDPVKGYNMNVTRTGTGFKDTRYEMELPDDEPTKVPSWVLEASKPLEELVEEYSEKRQKTLYYGQEEPPSSSRRNYAEDEEPENEEPEDEEPEDEEPEDEEPEDEEPEDEEPEDEEPEDEEPEDEEPEDEAPKKKLKTGKTKEPPSKKKKSPLPIKKGTSAKRGKK
jgi:hypothetical protein